MNDELFWELADIKILDLTPKQLDRIGDRNRYKELLQTFKDATTFFGSDKLKKLAASLNFRAARATLLEAFKLWFNEEYNKRCSDSKWVCKSTVTGEMALSQKTLDDFNIEPDKYVRNPHYRKADEMCLYSKFRLEYLIRTVPAIKARVEKLEARRHKIANPSPETLAKRERDAQKREEKRLAQMSERQRQQEMQRREHMALIAATDEVKIALNNSDIHDLLNERMMTAQALMDAASFGDSHEQNWERLHKMSSDEVEDGYGLDCWKDELCRGFSEAQMELLSAFLEDIIEAKLDKRFAQLSDLYREKTGAIGVVYSIKNNPDGTPIGEFRGTEKNKSELYYLFHPNGARSQKVVQRLRAENGFVDWEDSKQLVAA